jgi:hypothetical protein
VIFGAFILKLVNLVKYFVQGGEGRLIARARIGSRQMFRDGTARGRESDGCAYCYRAC